MTTNHAHGSSARSTAHILFLCHPLTGHLTPSLRVAADLHRRGWHITFLGPTAHQTRITASGAEFLPLQDDADIDDLLYYAPPPADTHSSTHYSPPVPGYHSLPWQDRALVDLEKHCLSTIPTQWRCVKDALAKLHAQHPERRVVIINEAFFMGILPLYLDAPLDTPKPKTLCLSITPPVIRSIDLPPFDYPLPFTQTQEGRARNAKAWDHWAESTASLKELLGAKLAEAGATRELGPETVVLDGVNYVCHDAVLQIGVPGFEYPRSDWPPHFQLVGFLPLAQAPAGGYPNLPGWWDEVTTAAKERRKKIVVVAQGTVETNPYDLIIPTIEAMRKREDVLVIAILGRKGARLPDGFEAPNNARVTDYLHYDAVLPYASVWVHNGGYGAITHGVAHAVPMVVAGEGQDKPENIKRVRYSEIGVGLGTAKPTVRDLRISLYDVLNKEKYTERIAVLRQETIELDCFGRIEKAVLDAIQ